MLVALGHHGTAAVPAAVADDVDLGGEEGVGGADDGADVHVVLEVLDGHMEGMAPRIEVGDDRLHRPIAVAIDDVARIALGQQLRIEPRVAGRVHGAQRRLRHVLVIVNLLRGMLIGVAEVIPGVSGGTVALIVGLYRRLIDAIADVVLAGRRLITGPRDEVGPLLRGLPWSMLIPVALGMITAIILGARFIEPLLDSHPEQMRALFFGLVAAGIAVPLGILTRTAPGGVGWRDGLLIAGAALVALVLTGLPPATVTDPPLIAVFLGAAIAICALVVPGVSGSFLLLSLGLYAATISAVNDRNITYLVTFALGAVAGLAVFVSFLRWLLDQHTRLTMAIIVGLMIGSLRALWPWQDDDRGLLAPSSDVLGVVLLALAGVAVVAALLWIERRLHVSEADR
jgi:putative membrane protein